MLPEATDLGLGEGERNFCSEVKSCTHIYFKVFLFGYEKRRSWPFGTFNGHLCHVSRHIRNIFQAVPAVTSKQKPRLCLLASDYAEQAFEICSPGDPGWAGPGPGPSGTRVWGKAGFSEHSDKIWVSGSAPRSLKWTRVQAQNLSEFSKSPVTPGCMARYLLLTSGLQKSKRIAFIS